MKKTLLIACFLLLALSNAFAQRMYSSRYNYNTVGVHLNAFNYYGDLAPKVNNLSFNTKLTSFGIGFDYTMKIWENLRLRSMISYGRIQGDDASSANPDDPQGLFRYARNLHFRNSIIETTEHIIYDFVKGKGRFYRRPTIVPYAFTGFAVTLSNPKARTPESVGDSWVALRPLATEGKTYGSTVLAVPVGLGVRYKVGDRIDIATEVCLRFTFTDYLDDVSGNYLGSGDYSNDLAKKMYNRTAESTSRFDDKPRDMTKVNAALGGTINDGGVERLSGMGMSGDTRGLPNKDAYISWSVSFNYIIGIKNYKPHPKK